MAGEGLLLREARQQKEWSLEQAEETTKIRIRYLEAIEEENYKILPGPTYVKGFLRNYAKHLGLDPMQIVGMYKSSEQDAEPPKTDFVIAAPRSKPSWLKPLLFTLVGLLLAVVILAISNLSKSDGKNPASDYSPAPLPSAPVAEKPTQTQSPIPSPTQSAAAQSAPQNVAQSTPPITASDDLKVVLLFNQSCWLQVKSDGKLALDGTFSQGMTRELTAKERIEFVTVGNAGGLSITVNGKPHPSLGGQGIVVRNVVIKKDTVPKLP